MRIVGLKLNNFMSYEKVEINGFGSSGLTLIEGVNHDQGGSNGAGKTSAFDGLSFAFFGQTVRGLSGDAVINRRFGDSCSCEVEIEDAGERFSVRRYRKHSDFGDRFILEDLGQGKSIEMGTIAQTQQWFNERFKIDFDLFRCTVLFAQGETFDFVSATNKEQKEILAKVMRIDYEDHLATAKSNVKTIEEKLSSITSKVAVLKSHLLDDPKEVYADDIKRWDDSRDAQVKGLVVNIKDYTTELDGLSKESGSNDDLAEFESKLIEAKKRVDGRLSDNMEKAVEISSRIRSIQSESSRIKELMADSKCPMCEQDIELKRFSSKITDCEHGLKDLEAAKVKLAADKAALTEKKDGYLNHLADVRKSMSTAETTKTRIKWLESKVTAAKREIKDLGAEVNPFLTKMLAEIERQEGIKGKLIDLEAEVNGSKKDLPYWQFWVNAFGDAGIKSFVFDLICGSLTAKANHYLNTLTNGSISVSFDTQKLTKTGALREKFDCQIHVDGEVVPFDAYSGGEKRRISLAVDLALSGMAEDWSGQGFGLILLDEQTDGLDQLGRSGVMSLLTELAKDRAVYVIDHSSAFRAMFENFLEDMGDPPSERHTVDRIDNDSDYSKDNCKWATMKEQRNNSSKNKFLSLDGKTMTCAQWDEYLGFRKGTICRRVGVRGWSAERALTTPVGKYR